MDNKKICGSCGISQCPNPCENPCEKPMPIFWVDNVPDDIMTLSFNFNGVGAEYNYTEMVKQGQTDTSVSIDVLNRLLKYMAERHTDTITAKELGAILHLADIGDVDGTDVEDKSLLFYNRETDCAQSCDTKRNTWKGWNALDGQGDALSMIMGFSNDGSPVSLSSPSQPNAHYLLSWAAGEKAKWTKPKTVTDATNLAPLYVDKTTGEIVMLEGS